MTELQIALSYALLAGVTIPIGGLLARREQVLPFWLDYEIRHTVLAFGGGVLLAAISLVLVPQGMEALSTGGTLLAFGAGALCFFYADMVIARHGGAAAQLMAMLLDYVPESLALGALIATHQSKGLLLALLIGLQNLPESFNAYRELTKDARLPSRTVLSAFTWLVVLGPLAAGVGYILQDATELIGAVMLFAAGGILYLTFQDIAPQAHLQRAWGPPLGAVGGFMLGLWGHGLLG
ncbi:ZIP family metal transporter [Dichotomicrobium thermohalophilum]|uniref:ZIP family zinc transporter n=1 Tax=Dichotomicrobium thermohalophilum TaxID=933063 RepID=A0A397Q5J7_9HYPH|nr:divalent cation transporter [Dichotomicrobium thermohalophilum]RIA56328.1 ZIP family zinc transporter [Dichotomicrobium thermohalophilum]